VEKTLDSLWLSLAAHTPSADNAQPWRFAVTGSSLEVHYCARAPHSLFGPDAHATQLAIGAMAYCLASAGATITWHDRSGTSAYFSATAPAHAPRNAEPFLQRHTNRHPYKKHALESALVTQLQGVGVGSARSVVVLDRSAISTLTNAVVEASRLRFLDYAQHQSLMTSLRFTPEAAAEGDGLDIATLHLPPGGKAFMQWITPWPRAQAIHRLGAASLMAKTEGQLFAACGGILAIIGGSTAEDITDAGGVMVQTWAQCNAAGLGVQPCYVLTDQLVRASAPGQPAWRGEVEKTLGLHTGQQLHMLLRIGTPKRTAVRAQRLPMDQLTRA
jgi:hypothetical protein